MNRMTAIALCAALIAWSGFVAYAQSASTADTRADQSQPAAVPVISLTPPDAGSLTVQAYSVAQPDGGTHLGAVVTRLELECVLSGKCDAAERRRVSY